MLKRRQSETNHMYDKRGRLIGFTLIETEELQGSPSELKELNTPKELCLEITSDRDTVEKFTRKCGNRADARRPVPGSGQPKTKGRT